MAESRKLMLLQGLGSTVQLSEKHLRTAVQEEVKEVTGNLAGIRDVAGVSDWNTRPDVSVGLKA